jgi:predicted secreted protein
MVAFVGRDVAVEFAIAVEDAVPASLTYIPLGMMRGKSPKVAWEVADTTADDSPEFTKTSLVTFKSVEFSGDGVSYTDAAFNQATLKAHVYNPQVATQFQPKAWFRITGPDGVLEGPFIITEWSDDRPYADAATWSITAMSNGAVTFTPA